MRPGEKLTQVKSMSQNESTFKNITKQNTRLTKKINTEPYITNTDE